MPTPVILTMEQSNAETVKMLLLLLLKHSDYDHDDSDFVDGDGDDGNVVGDGDFVHVSSAPRNPLKD